ncbi:MAG: DUF2207 domain-containing protein, partial [Ktedonobacterales bacterium]
VAAVPVRAVGSVSYEQRDYALQVLPNGDVAVVERWKVHFAGGPFHHAFLQIYLARTTGIDFGTATGASAGTQEVSNSTDDQGNPVQKVEWDFPSTQDASRSFDIPYTIHGGLGIGTSQAWLDWHFLDPGSQESFAVDESTVTVTLPAATKASDLDVKATDPDTQPVIKTVNAQSVQASVQHVAASNPFEVMVAFPRSEIMESVQRQPWQATDTPPAPPTSLGTQTGYPQPFNQPPSQPGGSGPSFLAGLGSLCGLFLIPAFILLVILSGVRNRAGYGPRGGYMDIRRPWGGWGGPWGPWYGGRGPWDGGGGFGGGMGGGMGGGGGGRGSGFG